MSFLLLQFSLSFSFLVFEILHWFSKFIFVLVNFIDSNIIVIIFSSIHKFTCFLQDKLHVIFSAFFMENGDINVASQELLVRIGFLVLVFKYYNALLFIKNIVDDLSMMGFK